MPVEQIIDVVCGVIADEQGRVLACRRREGGHLPGKWEFPGGKIEANETAASALVRELNEELGIQVAVGAPLTPVEFPYDDRSIRLIAFLCQITVGEPTAIEHSEIRWCSRETWWELDWAEADIPILHELSARS
ncbi:MAG: 8-oxo-dGTP diphosphatase MutT [Verrucomicrobiota bacterium]